MNVHHVGARVCVKGTSLDGKYGTIVARGNHEGRWTVDLGPVGRKNLRPENLEVLPPPRARAPAAPRPRVAYGSRDVGRGDVLRAERAERVERRAERVLVVRARRWRRRAAVDRRERERR